MKALSEGSNATEMAVVFIIRSQGRLLEEVSELSEGLIYCLSTSLVPVSETWLYFAVARLGRNFLKRQFCFS